MPYPLVSVCMPVYNGVPYIKIAIQSVLNNDYPNWELIMVDDASSDESPQIAYEYARRFPDKITAIIREEHKGLIHTRNEVISHCNGEFLACLDDDDIMKPDRLERQVDFLLQNPEVVLVGGYMEYINGKGRILRTETRPLDWMGCQNYCPQGNPFMHSSVMYRKSIIQAYGGYQGKPEIGWWGDDFSLWIDIMAEHPVANIPYVIGQRRLHGNCWTTRGVPAAAKITRKLELLDKIAERMPRLKEAVEEEKQKTLENPPRDGFLRRCFHQVQDWVHA